MAKVINPTGGGSGGYFPSVKFYNNTLDANSSVSMVGQGKTYNGVWKVDKQGHNLPSEYQEVEYIQSTGTQYIDTNYPTNDNVTFKAKINQTSRASSGVQSLYGYRFVNSATTSGNMRFFFIYNADGKIAIRYGATDDNSTLSLSINTDYIFEYRNSGVYVNDTLYATKNSQYATSTYGNGYIFKSNTDGYYSSDLSSFVGKMYYFKIWDNDILVRDYIPCYRKSDSVIGLYDLVTETFYTNSGSGTFLMGRPIDSLPDGYDEVEYIESSGSQYIDLQMQPFYNAQFEFDLLYKSIADTYQTFGCYSGSFYGVQNGSSFLRFIRPTNYYFDSSISANTRYRFKLDFQTTSLTSVGDITGNNSSSSTGALPTNNMYLFAMNGNGNKGSIALYSFKIYNNNVLLRNFVPCYRKTDGEIGLYDIVNNQFYSNDGTGTFKKGKVIGGYFDIDKVKDLGTYTWTATQGSTIHTDTLNITEPIHYDVFAVTYLYNEGNEYISRTGGWSCRNLHSSYQSGGSYSKNDDNITLTTASMGSMGMHTNNQISIANYTKLFVSAKVNTSDGFISSELADNFPSSFTINNQVITTTYANYFWDISSYMNTSKKVGVNNSNTTPISINRVWLE